MLLLSLSIVFLSLVFLSWRLSSSKHENPREPPSPPGLPIIGNLHQLGLYPHRSLCHFAAKHGPLMLCKFGQLPVVVASTMDVAREIMKTHDLAFSSRPASMTAEHLLYNRKDVAFAPYGEYWRQIKRICVLHLLSNRRVLSGHIVREEEVALVLQNITNSNKKSINLSNMLVELTNNITCRLALGRKYSGEVGVKELLREFNSLLGTISVGEYLPCLAWIDKLSGLESKMKKNAKEFDLLLERVVRDHNHNHNHNKELNNSFVDSLLSLEKNLDGEFSLDRESSKAIILDMFVAGTHTIFTAIDWVMVELIRHPQVMQKTQEEVRRITSKKAMVEEVDLEHMSYLKWVIKEVLRLHPPIPLLVPRETIEDVELQGYRIPKKMRVIINAWAIGRDPKVWERSDEFWPERFANSAEVDYKGQDFQLIPFGSGRRGCPGIIFASYIIELTVANLLYGFDWKLPEGVEIEEMDMTEATGFTTNRKAGLVLVATPHSQDADAIVTN